MKNVRLIVAACTIAATLLAASCNKKASDQTSKVAFKITDAPAQFDALYIDVQGVEVHTQGGAWVTYSSTLGVINILDYVNGNATVIAEGEISADATIDQIRLMLGSQNSVVVNGASYSLNNSAALQQQLTIYTSNQLQAGGSYEWTIDFDAAQSVVATGNGQFTLSPTLRLIVDPVTFTGTIAANGTGTVNIGGGTGGGTGSGSASGTITVTGLTGNITGGIGTTMGLASVCISNGTNTFCTMTSASGQFNFQAVATG
ncbi:MAG TPA: DUF4382 domain-containing protein, partial [Chitinophagales bacterium]|nr:DUF4382 domain-containing protein [Chitinophagales bacterium]